MERTICGTAMKSIEFLRPATFANHPTTTVPMKPPIPSMAPIQPISGIESGPVGNGQFSEFNTRKADAIHPTEQP